MISYEQDEPRNHGIVRSVLVCMVYLNIPIFFQDVFSISRWCGVCARAFACVMLLQRRYAAVPLLSAAG